MKIPRIQFETVSSNQRERAGGGERERRGGEGGEGEGGRDSFKRNTNTCSTRELFLHFISEGNQTPALMQLTPKP